MKEMTSLDISCVGGADGFLSPTINFSPTGTDVFGAGVAINGIAGFVEKGFEYALSPVILAGNDIVNNINTIIKNIFKI